MKQSIPSLPLRRPHVPPKPLTPAQAQFVGWLRVAHPALYARVIPKLTGDAATNPDPVITDAGLGGWDDLTSAISKIGSTYVETRAALATIKANAQRASAGLPPTVVTAAPAPSAGESVSNFLRDNQLMIVLPLVAFLGWRALKGGRR